MTLICVINLTIIGSYNGLSPGRRQAIIWTKAGILLIGPLETNFSEILIEIHTFAFKKMQLKTSSGKWRPFCLGLNVLSKSSCSSNHGLFLLLVGAGYGRIHNPPTTSCNIMTDFQANLHPDTDMAENMTVKIEGIIVKIRYMSLHLSWLR